MSCLILHTLKRLSLWINKFLIIKKKWYAELKDQFHNTNLTMRPLLMSKARKEEALEIFRLCKFEFYNSNNKRRKRNQIVVSQFESWFWMVVYISGWMRPMGGLFDLLCLNDLFYKLALSFNVDISLIVWKYDDTVNLWWVEIFVSKCQRWRLSLVTVTLRSMVWNLYWMYFELASLY